MCLGVCVYPSGCCVCVKVWAWPKPWRRGGREKSSLSVFCRHTQKCSTLGVLVLMLSCLRGLGLQGLLWTFFLLLTREVPLHFTQLQAPPTASQLLPHPGRSTHNLTFIVTGQFKGYGLYIFFNLRIIIFQRHILTASRLTLLSGYCSYLVKSAGCHESSLR